MKRFFFGTIAASLFSVAACCQTAPVQKQGYIDFSAIDSSVKPGDDFYQYANGTWRKNAVIPPTESEVGAGLDVYNRTKDHLHIILEGVAKGGFAKGSIEQQVGDFYASGMDSVTIEKRGYDPIKPTLAQINAIKNAHDIMQYVAGRAIEGNYFLIDPGIAPDEKNSSVNIAIFSQTGLGLPDRDYYFKTDSTTQAAVNAYKAYLEKLFMLTGDDSTNASKKMMLVYDLENKIAASHKTNTEIQDPQANYNMMAISDLDKQMPLIGWPVLLTNLGAKVISLNIQQPAYYNKLNELLNTIPMETWKAYLRAHLLANSANGLSSPFVNASFNYTKALYGRQKIKPRWERIYAATDARIGYALGQLYVKKYFTEDTKKRVLDLLNNLQAAFAARINKLDWMGDSTKKIALNKLQVFIKKIGYPDKWRDYSDVVINRATYFENRVSCAKDEYRYQLSKLGQPVDKTEWLQTPPTVNAYYNPTFNEIVFPAGILQFPFFDPAADDAINYGAIGMVMGHEMTHGFDNDGSQYDKDGNLKNWWTSEDSTKFHAKINQVVKLYNSFIVFDTTHINGALTTGENIADMGGINIAYDAFKLTKQGQGTATIDGLTPDQRFFLSFAQSWRAKEKEAFAKFLIIVDVHSPNKFRVDGVLMNIPAFYKAFNVKPGDKMYLPESEQIKIW